MSHLIYTLLFLLILWVAFTSVKKIKLQTDKAFPYQKIQTLLSPAERSFFGVLEKTLGNDYRVFSKIRLADVVQVKNGLSRAARQRAFNSISSKHVDFLICDTSGMAIRGAIELDDQSQNNPQRVKRDIFVDKVFEASNIPLLRVKARANYSISEITSLLESCQIIKPKNPPDLLFNDKNRVENERESTKAKIGSGGTAASIASKKEPACPRCGAGLIKKVATKGRYVGQKYLGCSNFPHCRYATRSN